MKTMRFLKATDGTRHGSYGNPFKFALPKQGKRGKWMSLTGPVEMCYRGLHFIKPNWASVCEHAVQGTEHGRMRLWVVEVPVGDRKVTRMGRRDKGVSLRMRFLREVKGWDALVTAYCAADTNKEERAVFHKMKALLRRNGLGRFTR